MRGVYTVTYRIAANTAAKSLLLMTAAANKPIDILSASVTNESNETNEQLVCCLQRVTALGAPTGTVVTPAKHEPGDQAAAGAYKANITAGEPTYGASAQGAAMVDAYGLAGVPSLSGWGHAPIPEERITIGAGETYGLRLLVALAAAADLAINVTFQEKG